MIIVFEVSDFKRNESCPWCGSSKGSILYTSQYDCEVIKCEDCGFVYASKILNKKGVEKYWTNYTNREHLADSSLNEKRKAMYAIEHDWIEGFIPVGCDILDIGCSQGAFLDTFEKKYNCHGVELDSVAAKLAAEKGYIVYNGDVCDYESKNQYDLIVLRGIIQYFLKPREAFEKICELVRKDGYIYIYMVNADALCFGLFKEQFTLSIKVTEYWGYTEALLTEYFKKKGFKLVGYRDYYEGTPYAEIENDISIVHKALVDRENNRKLTYKSPAFWGNMLGLMYKKC